MKKKSLSLSEKSETELVKMIRLYLYEPNSFNAEKFSQAWNLLLEYWESKKRAMLAMYPEKLGVLPL